MGQVRTSHSGFTLIELLIVIAIIGILAAVAIPYYQGYMVRARLVEVENAMSILKSAVSGYRQEREDSWPNCPTIVEIRNSLAVSLSSVGRMSSVSITDGVITATVQNIHPMVDNKTITLRPTLAADGSIGWRWETSPDFPLHLRPKH